MLVYSCCSRSVKYFLFIQTLQAGLSRDDVAVMMFPGGNAEKRSPVCSYPGARAERGCPFVY